MKSSHAKTHHLCVVGKERLFVKGEFLRAEGAVQLNHLRKLQRQGNEKDSSLRLAVENV